jgi:hypothetical protein
LIFEAPRYLAFLRSLTEVEAIRLLTLVYSVYLDPTPDAEHIFHFSALDAPEFHYALDGEFRIDFVVLSDTALILLDATRARRP